MLIERIDHSDVLERLSGVPGADELRFVVLADRIVDGEVDVTVFAPGSLEPIAIGILRHLHDYGPTSIGTLAELLTPGDASYRVIKKTVSALERATHLTTERAAGNDVLVRPLPLPRLLGIKMDFRLERVQFLPASRRIDVHIRGRRLTEWEAFLAQGARSAVCEMEWPELYDPRALHSAIAAAYVASYRSRFQHLDDVALLRHELLQRSQLLPTRERVRVAVRQTKLHDFVVLYRCYLYRIMSGHDAEWKAMTRRYPGGGEIYAYSKNVARASEDHRFLANLIHVSQPVW